MCMNTILVAWPCASMVSAVFLKSCPTPSKLRVWLFGGGPGVNFDFSRLSFHGPIRRLLCVSPIWDPAVANAADRSPKARMARRFMLSSSGGHKFPLVAPHIVQGVGGPCTEVPLQRATSNLDPVELTYI